MHNPQLLRGFYQYLLLTAIALAAFLVSLDGFIVNVAITTISGDLGVREDVGTWVITLFSIASTACVPLSGFLSRKFGNYPVFMFGIILFTIASFLCGMSHTFQFLLFSRVLQGAAAGLITPVSLALIIHHFPEEKRSVAIGFWSFFVMVGPAMGPMIGGWFADYRWHWMFYLNLPIAFFSMFIVWLFLHSEREDKNPLLPLDTFGLMLFFICIGSLQVAMNRWNIDDWFRSPFITSLFILAGLCLIFFIVWEIFHPSPFINLSMIARRNFALPSFTTAFGMGMLFSSFVLDSLWVQAVLGYTPGWAGLSLSPLGIFPLIFYPIIGRYISLMDLRIWVIISFLLYSFTFFWLSEITVYTPFWLLAMPRLIQGIGFAIFTVPNAMLVIRGVAHEHLTTVISLFSFFRMLFVGFGVAIGVTLWIFRQTFYQSRMTARAVENNPLFTDLFNTFDSVTASTAQKFALSYQTIVAESSTLALADIYYLYAWIFIALCFVVLFYKTSNG